VATRSISIVVPVFNEQDSLAQLVREIHEMADRAALAPEVLFVDDGSTDASWSVICRLAEGDATVGGLRFRRNMGKAAALMAGFATVRADTIITLDADLQDPPGEIPALLEKLDEGFDLVSGWKWPRFDPWHKVYPSRVFNRLVSLLTGVHLHDHVCGLKGFRRTAMADLRIYGELHRFLGVLAASRGHRVSEIATTHRRRTTGTSKYGFSRFAKGFVDLFTVLAMTRFHWRPQHLLGVVGAWLLVVSPVVAIAGLISPWFARLGPALVLATGGMGLIALGLLAELVVAERPLSGLYDVVERTGWCERQGAQPESASGSAGEREPQDRSKVSDSRSRSARPVIPDEAHRG
jgi:dolichol-phosphate mannosyltransferase